MTRTTEPVNETKTANILAAELINEHEANRGWSTRERIELTPEQASELRKGFADGRCAWGIIETSRGRVRWMVLQEPYLDASRQVREGYVLRYDLTDPPIPKKKPDHLATSVAMGYALNSVQSKARYHLTASLTTYKSHPITVKLEAWATTPEQKDKVLTHWKSLKATDIQEEQRREPTEDEVSQDAYYKITGKRLRA